MLGSIPHQKFYFYHLPSRGQAGIKLGDADTSPTYLQFLIVPCCSIIILGCFIIILQSFYIIFGTNRSTQCIVPVAVFCMFFTSQEINTKRSPNAAKLFVDFFGPQDIQWAGEAPGWLCPPAQARPGGLCPPRVPPGPPLCSINTPIFPKPYGSRQIFIQPPQSPEPPDRIQTPSGMGFTTSLGASLMMREQFFVDLRVRSQQLDGFLSLSLNSQQNGLLEIHMM